MSNPSPNRDSELRVTAYDRVSSWLVSLLVMTSVLVAALLMVYFARGCRRARWRYRPSRCRSPAAAEEAREAKGARCRSPISPSRPNRNWKTRSTRSPPRSTRPSRCCSTRSSTPLRRSSRITSTRASPARRAAAAAAEPASARAPAPAADRVAAVAAAAACIAASRNARSTSSRANLLEYARYLDFFKIELGVLGRDNKVYYAYNLSQQTPSVREGKPDDELRLYMNSALGRFAALDRRLAQRAKSPTVGRSFCSSTRTKRRPFCTVWNALGPRRRTENRNKSSAQCFA